MTLELKLLAFILWGWGGLEKELSRSSAALIIMFSIQVGSSTSLIFPDASSWCGDNKAVFQPGKQFSAPAMQENEQDTTRKLLFPLWHQILSPSTHSLPLHFISPSHSSHCPTIHTPCNPITFCLPRIFYSFIPLFITAMLLDASNMFMRYL